MSRQEVRQEYKESEGSPEVKGRIRQLHHPLARQRMMQNVPKADVIIINPTHLAVTLRYDEKRMRAPVVVAKGVDRVAARIRELAQAHGVTLVEAPPLARVLYRQVELKESIPAALFVAVAQVLTYVFQLRQAQQIGEPAPSQPDVDVFAMSGACRAARQYHRVVHCCLSCASGLCACCNWTAAPWAVSGLMGNSERLMYECAKCEPVAPVRIHAGASVAP